MIRRSSSVWRGNGMQGQGALTTQSGVFKDQPFGFNSRFVSEDGRAGTNPEELIGAAHAGCYSMALAFALTDAGHPPEELKVTAAVDLQKDGDGFSIKTITLSLEGKVPGVDAATFQKIAEGAKKGCPVSKALAGVDIKLDAKLL